MKPGVITPYYNESIEILKRCHRSVVAQTAEATHFLVADGHGRAVIDHWIANICHYRRKQLRQHAQGAWCTDGGIPGV